MRLIIMQFIYCASPVHIALIFHPSTSEEENNGLDAGSRQKLVVIGGGGAQMPNNLLAYMHTWLFHACKWKLALAHSFDDGWYR